MMTITLHGEEPDGNMTQLTFTTNAEGELIILFEQDDQTAATWTVARNQRPAFCEMLEAL